jgi:acyl-homoserine lactone synthase
MIRIIDRHNRTEFENSLDQNFRLRRDIFVVERGWTDFDRGIYETDQYDTEDTVYVVSIDASDNVVGGFRLYPSVLPHMLSETFAHMVDGRILQRPDIFELSRLGLAQSARNSRTYCELFLGLLECGLALGLSGTTALIRTLRIPVVQTIGLSVIPLGLPREIDQESQTAILIEIDEASLARVRRSANRHESVLEAEGGLRRAS